jgi:O-antigen ligase
MFLDRPLLGCGFGQYKEIDVDYLSNRTVDLQLFRARPYHQHNVLLALLTEIGLIGSGLFVTLLACWTRDAWRLWNHRQSPLLVRQQGLLFLALMVAYVVNGMFHDLAIIPMVHMLLFFMAGVTAALVPQVVPGECGWLSARLRSPWMPLPVSLRSAFFIGRTGNS